MTYWMIVIAVMLLICLIVSRIGGKVGMPALLIFIALGMVVSALSIFPKEVESLSYANNVCTVGLIFIMFTGGFGTNWARVRPVAVQAGLLSSVGVILTALVVAAFCTLVMHTPFTSGLLVGSVISSTDAASVFSILRSKKINLRYNTAPLLEAESGSNDPCASIMMLLTLSIQNGTATFGSTALLFVSQVGIGIGIGVLVAIGTSFLLGRLHLENDAAVSIFTVGIVLLTYGAADKLGGNGYLAIYLLGIILGNRAIPGKRAMTHFFDGIAALSQVMVFFVLGMVVTPSGLLRGILPSFTIAVFLLVVARPLVVFVLMKPFKAPRPQRLMADWCGIRGASSIVFAMTAAMESASSQANSRMYIFHIVFFIVLISVLLQGSLLTKAAKVLKMIDPHADVMRTFADTIDESPIQFIRFTIGEKHPWCGRLIRDVQPSDMLGGGRIVMLIRGGIKIAPRGHTCLEKGDIAVIAGRSLEGVSWGALNELHVGSDHNWVNRSVHDVATDGTFTVVMIERKGEMIIPHSDTLVLEGDTVILNEDFK